MKNEICQFYVILGKKDFIPPQENAVYINAIETKDLKELSNKILETYKEKAKLGLKVGSEIIFLIPSEKYKTQTEEIIKKLRVNGKIELMKSKVDPFKVKETVNMPIPPRQPIKPNPVPKFKEEELKKDLPDEPKIETQIIPEKKVEEVIPISIEPKKEESTTSYQPTDNIYRGTVDNNIYTNFNKQKKNNKNKIAIIIFIISLLFFIGSLILLFLV